MSDPTKCSKPGCGALKAAPCTDCDCPQSFVPYAEFAALMAENAELRELCGKAFHKLGDMVAAALEPMLTDGELDQYLEGYDV